MRVVVLCLVFAIVLAQGANAAEVLEPEALRRNFSAPGIAWLRMDQPTVTGTVVRYNESVPELVSGKIAYFVITGEIPVIIRKVQSAGPIGLLLTDTLSEYAGTYDLVMRWDTEGIVIPVVQIGSTDTELFDKALEDFPDQVVVTIGGPPEFNLWTAVRTHPIWIAIQVVLSGLAVFAGSFATAKLIAYMRYRGRPEFSVPQMCLAFEVVANILRLIFWCMDPVFIIRGIFSYATTNFLLTITHPAMIASTLLVALYWHEMLKKSSVRVAVGLEKMRIPFIIIVIILFGLEIATAAMRTADFDPGALVTVTAALELIVCLASSIYFFVIGSQVIKQLNASSNVMSGKSEKQKSLASRTTHYVIASGVLEILFIIVVALAVVPSFFWNPFGFYVLLSLKDVILFAISIVQILTFTWPPRTAVGGGSGGPTRSTAAAGTDRTAQKSGTTGVTTGSTSNISDGLSSDAQMSGNEVASKDHDDDNSDV